jgi:thiol-disulfide isomerase/thioredoxin
MRADGSAVRPVARTVLRTRPRLLAALLVAVLGLGLVAGCSTGDDAAVHGGSFTFVSPGGKKDISYAPGDRGSIGTLSGPNLMTNKTISLDDYAGKVVVINFWGSWCAPCREEQPGLNLTASQLADRGVQFLGIDLREPGQSAGQDYHRNFQVPYPSIYDPTMRTILSLRGYPAAYIPAIVVLDRQHRVAQIWLTSALVPMGTMKSTIEAIAAEGSSRAGGSK